MVVVHHTMCSFMKIDVLIRCKENCEWLMSLVHGLMSSRRGYVTFSSSSNVFFKLYRYDSKPLRALIRPWTFLSSSANSSASRTMRSISSSDNRPLSAVMVIFSALPVPLSAADTVWW